MRATHMVTGSYIMTTAAETHMDQLVIRHLGKTKDELIVQELSFLSSSYGEVLSRAEHVAKRLEELDCFEKVHISIDSSKGADATAQGLEVVLQVEEVPWIQLGLTCLEGNEENNGGLAIRMPNILGKAEKAEMSWIYSLPSGKHNYDVKLTKPIAVRGNSVLHLNVYKRESQEGKSASQLLDSSVPDSAYIWKSKGFNTGVSFDSWPNTRPTLAYENQWHTQTCVGKEVPNILQDQCGYTTKSSVLHQVDWQDCKPHAPAMPAHGAKLRMTNEFAGMGGDIGFFKNEIHAEKAAPLLKNLTGQVVGQAGMINTTSDTFLLTPDKFYLGGPTSVRGFDHRGIKQESDSQALGDYIYYASGLHLYYRVPGETFHKRFGENLRLHAFTNFERNSDQLLLVKAYDNTTLLGTMLCTNHIACDLGLCVPLGEQFKMEFNYWNITYEPKLQIFARTPDGQNYSLVALPCSTIAELKAQLLNKAGLGDVRLLFGCRELLDHETVAECEIDSHATISILFRFCGGTSTLASILNLRALSPAQRDVVMGLSKRWFMMTPECMKTFISTNRRFLVRPYELPQAVKKLEYMTKEIIRNARKELNQQQLIDRSCPCGFLKCKLSLAVLNTKSLTEESRQIIENLLDEPHCTVRRACLQHGIEEADIKKLCRSLMLLKLSDFLENREKKQEEQEAATGMHPIPCNVCYTSPAQIMTLPCGHLCTCMTCSQTQILQIQRTKCVLCRQDVKSIHRVYY